MKFEARIMFHKKKWRKQKLWRFFRLIFVDEIIDEHTWNGRSFDFSVRRQFDPDIAICFTTFLLFIIYNTILAISHINMSFQTILMVINDWLIDKTQGIQFPFFNQNHQHSIIFCKTVVRIFLDNFSTQFCA